MVAVASAPVAGLFLRQKSSETGSEVSPSGDSRKNSNGSVRGDDNNTSSSKSNNNEKFGAPRQIESAVHGDTTVGIAAIPRSENATATDTSTQEIVEPLSARADDDDVLVRVRVRKSNKTMNSASSPSLRSASASPVPNDNASASAAVETMPAPTRAVSSS
jgi:hypothetical protein